MLAYVDTKKVGVGRSEARAQEGFQKARPLPNLTPSPLNVVNAHCSLFKAYPLVRAAKCLDTRASRRNDKRLEGHGGPSGGVPHCLRRSAQAWTCLIGPELSAIRAAAARHALVLDDLAIKVVLRLDNAAKEHPAVHAGVGALEAGVVRLYSVVVILSGWVRVGCARLCGVHSL